MLQCSTLFKEVNEDYEYKLNFNTVIVLKNKNRNKQSSIVITYRTLKEYVVISI